MPSTKRSRLRSASGAGGEFHSPTRNTMSGLTATTPATRNLRIDTTATATGRSNRATRGRVAANPAEFQLEFTDDPEHIGKGSISRSGRDSVLSKAGHTGALDSTPALTSATYSRRPSRLPGVLEYENVRSAHRSLIHAFDASRGPSPDSMYRADVDGAVATIDTDFIPWRVRVSGQRKSESPSHRLSTSTARSLLWGLSDSKIARGVAAAYQTRTKAFDQHPPRPRTFRDMFWSEWRRGWRYCGGRWAISSAILANCLLPATLCSAGPICRENHFLSLLRYQLFAHPVETICLVCMYALMISGMGDVFMATVASLQGFGRRIGRDPQVHGWENWRPMFQHLGRNLVCWCCDAGDLVLEPALMLALPLALRWQCDMFTSGTLAFLVSLTLHIAKWLLQAVEVHGHWRGRVPYLRWAAKPFVLCFLVLLALAAGCLVRETIAATMPQPVQAWIGARAFWMSEGFQPQGRTVSVGAVSWPSRAVSTPVYVVTSIVMATGLVPTTTVSG